MKTNEKLSILFECLPKDPTKDPLDIIINRVSQMQTVPVTVMGKKTRQREVVFARQLYFYIARELLYVKKYSLKNSLQVIANKFGKDHATVLHGCKTINNLKDTDKNLRLRIEEVLQACNRDLQKALDIDQCKHPVVIKTSGILYHCDICGETKFIPEGSEEMFSHVEHQENVENVG